VKTRILVPLIMIVFAQISVADAATPADPCSGPDQEIDLAKDMPPIDDQGVSNLCGIFSMKALLDYNIHQSCLKNGGSEVSCAYSPNNRVSAEDLSAFSDPDPKNNGNAFNLNDVNDMYFVLSGVQSGTLVDGKVVGPVMDRDLPFDLTLFGTAASTNNSLLKRLSEYYSIEELRLSAPDNPQGTCYEDDHFKDLIEQFPNLQAAADASMKSSGFADFEDAVVNRDLPDSVREKRKPFPVPFNISDVDFGDRATATQYIVDTLKKSRQPLETELCYDDLAKGLGLQSYATKDDPCGPHAMVIIGFRKQGSQCEVLLRNSWGDYWPENVEKPNGTAWVNMKEFFSATSADTPNANGTYLMHIEPRDPKSKPILPVIQIVGVSTDIGTLTGETWEEEGKLHGCGYVEKDGKKSCSDGDNIHPSNPHCCTLRSNGQYPF
jgi:hypothetical protein